MSKYNFLLQLLPLVERYEETTDPERQSVSSFAAWLPDNLSVQPGAEQRALSSLDARSVDSEASWCLIDLYKYLKQYSKKVLEQTPIRSIEDYGFLRTLLENESLLKGELIHKNIVELTTGTDVVKRLLGNQLVAELPDPNDKRAKRVQITALGRAEMEAVQEKMDQITHLLCSGIMAQDKKQLLFLLDSLSRFHDRIYQADRKHDWAQIWAKYQAP